MNRLDLIKVFIVDDVESHRRRLMRIVESDGALSVSGTASSGHEAATKVAHNPPDIVMMDVAMEHQTAGIEAARVINQANPNVRVIILTIHNDENVIRSAFQTGVVDFLLKSEPADTILAAIHSAMQNASPLRSYVASRLRTDYRRSTQNEERLKKTIRLMADLSPAEIAILRLLREGRRRREVAEARFVSEDTVKKQINSLLKKCGNRSTRELINELEELGVFAVLNDIG